MIIPDEIVVGFKKQQHAKIKGIDDVYHDGPSYLLGFATFMEHGTLRKKISWEGWRDKSIEPQTLKNIPREGFKFAEFNKRSSEWFGSGRTMFRVSDPYGFDLEITASNLMAIICNCNITEGQIDGEFVWAWEGKELALLSVNSYMYIEATETTRKKNSKTIPFSEIKNGDEIETSDEKKYTYIGKCWALESDSLDTYCYSYRKAASTKKYGKTWQVKRYHVVMNKNGHYELFTSLKVISQKPSGKIVLSIEDFVRNYNLSKESSDLIKLARQPQNYAPVKMDVERVYNNPVLSIEKIKIEDIIRENVDIDFEIANLKIAGNKYSHPVEPMFSLIAGNSYYAVGAEGWTVEDVNTNMWNKAFKPAYATAIEGTLEIDKKNDKMSFINEIPSKQSWSRNFSTKDLTEEAMRNHIWFRYFIVLNGTKYLA